MQLGLKLRSVSLQIPCSSHNAVYVVNLCFQIVVLEKTLKSPLESKEIKPVNPKGNQPWIFIGRTDAEAEVPILSPPDAKSLIIGKDPDAGKDWRQEEEEMTEDEMVGWHHWFNGHEFEQTRGQWRTGRPDMLQAMGSQRVRQDLMTEQQKLHIECSLQCGLSYSNFHCKT